MKNFTLDWVRRQVTATPDNKRLPQPFPGRRNPTRLAWGYSGVIMPLKELDHSLSIELGRPVYKNTSTTPIPFAIHYNGKPNAYRCREFQKFALGLGAKNLKFHENWIIEYDLGGVLAIQQFDGKQWRNQSTSAYFAYHPQDAAGDIVGAFLKPLHMKRLGRLPLYSHTKTLSLDKIDQYYSWFEQTFKKRLRRPKQAPMVIENLVHPMEDL